MMNKEIDIEVDESQGALYARFPFNRALISLVKQAGFKWSAKRRVWHCEDNNAHRIAIRTVFPFVRDLAGWELPPPDWSRIMNYKHNPILMQHQREGVKIAMENPRWGFFYDTGVGKTLMAIEIVKYYSVKTLIVCPKSIIEPAWMQDIEKFAPELAAKTVNLWACKNRRGFENIVEKYDICLINYESFSAYERYLINAGFSMVILDESSKVKSPKSGITKKLIRFTDKADYVYLLSGTPAPNRYLEYWSQLRLLNLSLLGNSFYAFRDRFFSPAGFGGFKWKQKEESADELLQKIASLTSVVRKEAVLDLPERVNIIRDVYLSPKEMKAYKDMAKHLVVEIENKKIATKNAATKIMKLRQFTSGFVYDEDKIISVIGNSKLKCLDQLLDEIGDRPVVIWTQFRHEAEQIKAMLDAGEKAAAICNGTVPQTQRDVIIPAFIKGDIQYLIAHPKSVGHGITLVNASHAIYYGLSYSHEEHYQSRDRIYRYGQKNACTYYYLLAPGTIDPVMYKALEEKSDVAEACLQYIKDNNFQKGKKCVKL